MLLCVFLCSDIALSGIFDEQQNQTFLVFLALTICIFQLFCGLCLSWFRCLWPTWVGQILLLAGLKSLQCAPFQTHGNSAIAFSSKCPRSWIRKCSIHWAHGFLPFSSDWYLLTGINRWEKFLGALWEDLWLRESFALTCWRVLIEVRNTLKGKVLPLRFSLLLLPVSALLDAHLTPAAWALSHYRKKRFLWQWYCWDPWVWLHSLHYKRYFSSLISLPHSRASHCTKCLLFPCCLCCTCSDWWGGRPEIEDTMACASISFLFLTWSHFLLCVVSCFLIKAYFPLLYSPV